MASLPKEVLEPTPVITIDSSGHHSPAVTIQNHGLVQFVVSQYPDQRTQCNVHLTITFTPPTVEKVTEISAPLTQEVAYTMSSSGAAAGTIKIGS